MATGLCYSTALLYIYMYVHGEHSKIVHFKYITKSRFFSAQLIYCVQSNLYRVLKCDVIKVKFLKLWDFSGYSERTMSKRPTCQK